MTDAPERIWTFESDWSDDEAISKYATHGPFIRLDLHEAAIAAARAEGMREAAKLAEDYLEWCANWGEHRNQVAAATAAAEIAAAIRGEADK